MAKVALEIVVVIAVVAIGGLLRLPVRAIRGVLGLNRHIAASSLLTLR